MKLQPDRHDAQTITGHGPGWVAVGSERVTSSVLVNSSGQVEPWPCQGFDTLSAQHFEQIARLGCEIVIFGSGSRLRFPDPRWLASLMQHRIGLETMGTAAACRTYNILAGEGRHVVAALLIEPAT